MSMYLQKVRVISEKLRNFFLLLKPWRSLTKITGSGSASGTISQRYGSADPHPDRTKISWIRNTVLRKANIDARDQNEHEPMNSWRSYLSPFGSQDNIGGAQQCVSCPKLRWKKKTNQGISRQNSQQGPLALIRCWKGRDWGREAWIRLLSVNARG